MQPHAYLFQIQMWVSHFFKGFFFRDTILFPQMTVSAHAHAHIHIHTRDNAFFYILACVAMDHVCRQEKYIRDDDRMELHLVIPHEKIVVV